MLPALWEAKATGSPQCSHSLPGTSLTKACETQFLGRPDLAEVELLLWACYFGLELPGPKGRLVSKGAESPQSILLPNLWEAKKQLALHSALTAYRQRDRERPVRRSFLEGLIWLR
ncbi:hypothetical protein ABE44_04540 [Bacillus thuringiensis]|nr:hypothetical protein [Bacillus thuringiensis]